MNILIKHIENFNTRVEVTNRACTLCNKKFKHFSTLNIPDNNVCNYCNSLLDTWLDVKINKDKNTAVVNKRVYGIGEPNAKFKGCGGAKVRIKFYDGREVVTDNLWCGLEIPTVWQKDFCLVDTATMSFI